MTSLTNPEMVPSVGTFNRLDVDARMEGQPRKGMRAMRGITRSWALAVAVASVAALGACTSSPDDETATPSVTASETASSDATSEAGYDPALSAEDRVALVSDWAQARSLLTGEEVVAALGESATKVVNAASTDIWVEGSGGFYGPLTREIAMDAEIHYTLQRDSRSVIFVWEALTQETYAAVEEAAVQRFGSNGRYDPAPIGIDAFAYETDGGAGALDRMVVVNTGDALIVIEAIPASPEAPEDDLTEGENLTREQVDNLVKAAVEKLG